jgi:large subunit ribosomal protein L22
MPVTAKLRHLHIAPRKVRLVVDLIRGKKTEQAQTILNFTTKKASLPLLKLLKQAIANAKNNFQMEPANLFISKIFVDEGPKQKRWMPRARGQAYEIQKKTSHITLVLEEIVKKKGKIKKAKTKISSAKADPIKKEAEEKIFKTEKPKFKPETRMKKPTVAKRIAKIFRRKSI